jgi:hypothetical protein
MTTEYATKAVTKVQVIAGIAIHVVTLKSYLQRAKAGWSQGVS